MKAIDNRIKSTIESYCNGTLDPRQADILEGWLKSDPANHDLFRNYVAERVDSKVMTDTHLQWQRVSSMVYGARKSSLRRRLWIGASSAAAVAITALALFFTVNTDKETAITAEAANKAELVYYVPRGEMRNITLPDGSTVKLGSAATLTLAEDFGDERRDVYFDGEGFFEVAHDPSRPFVVHSAGIDYVVKGTSFNLESYVQDDYAVVTLHSGSLATIVDDDQYMLSPNEAIEIDKVENSVKKKRVEVANSIGWIEGVIKFDKTPIKMVAKKLSRYYGVKIEVDPALSDQIYTGIVDNETLEESLFMIVHTSHIKMQIQHSAERILLSKSSNKL